MAANDWTSTDAGAALAGPAAEVATTALVADDLGNDVVGFDDDDMFAGWLRDLGFSQDSGQVKAAEAAAEAATPMPTPSTAPAAAAAVVFPPQNSANVHFEMAFADLTVESVQSDLLPFQRAIASSLVGVEADQVEINVRVATGPAVEEVMATPVAAEVAPAAAVSGAGATGDSHTGVHSTWWAAASDSGGCELPEGVTYALPYALALGDESALGDLSCARSNNLCGLIVSVQCGTNAAINAVITSVCNKGSGTCGVDLVGKAWDAATGGASPGIEDCTVTLTDGTPIAGSSPVCAQRPSAIAGNSQWYTSVGMFNTGRPVVSATLNGITGKFNGDSNYFDFQAAGGVTFVADAPLTMTFEDGTTETLTYGECTAADSTHIFGGNSRLRMQAASEERTAAANPAQIHLAGHSTAGVVAMAAAAAMLVLVLMAVLVRRSEAAPSAVPFAEVVQQGRSLRPTAAV
jgi:hypothetical protein